MLLVDRIEDACGHKALLERTKMEELNFIKDMWKTQGQGHGQKSLSFHMLQGLIVQLTELHSLVIAICSWHNGRACSWAH